MDKFGIFNLLSSLAGSPNKNPLTENSENKNNTPDFSKLLSSIIGEQNFAQKPSPPPVSTPREFKPLQNSMLDTMTRHDEIIKRIKARQK